MARESRRSFLSRAGGAALGFLGLGAAGRVSRARDTANSVLLGPKSKVRDGRLVDQYPPGPFGAGRAACEAASGASTGGR